MLAGLLRGCRSIRRTDVQTAIFDLLDVGNDLWQRQHKRSELPGLQHRVASAVTRIEMYQPASEIDLKLHNWLHLASQIARAGPLWVQACWAHERTYGR